MANVTHGRWLVNSTGPSNLNHFCLSIPLAHRAAVQKGRASLQVSVAPSFAAGKDEHLLCSPSHELFRGPDAPASQPSHNQSLNSRDGESNVLSACQAMLWLLLHTTTAMMIDTNDEG